MMMLLSKTAKQPALAKLNLFVIISKKNGGIPVLIPRDSNLEEIVKTVDGFALPGGMAVNPKSYNRPKHPKTMFDEIKEDGRFKLEEAFVRNAVSENKPVLGICRGMHAGNVILGKIWQETNPDKKLGDKGTLIQYIPEKFPDDSEHRDSNAFNFRPKDTVIWQEQVDNGNPKLPHPFEASHDIKITPNSKLAKLIKKEQIGCYSWHNQGVGLENLAPQLTPCAYSVKKDGSVNYGIIEAAEYKNIMLVQSHPETGVGNISHLLFQNLVDNAKEQMKTKDNRRSLNLELILPYYQNAKMVVADIKAEAYKNIKPKPLDLIKTVGKQR